MKKSGPVILGLVILLLLGSSLAFIKGGEEVYEGVSVFKGVEKNRPGLTLEETFNLYVTSVQNSDLGALFSTVTEKESFFFLTAQGRMLDSREEYYRFHAEWFEGENWQMPVELVEVFQKGDIGYTLARFHYKEGLANGRTRNMDSYFTLIFERENDMWMVVADICTPISRYTSETDSGLKYSPEQDFLFSVLKTRRTVRKFLPSPVPREHILKIIDAARFAPTSGNQQPWKFLVIQDKDKLEQLETEASKWYLDSYKARALPTPQQLTKVEKNLKPILANVLSAPVYIAVLVSEKTEYPGYILYDGTLAAGSLMIAARSLGYGTGFFTTFFPENKMKEFFRVPDTYRLICFTPVGIPEKWPEAPQKKSLDDLIVFEEF